MVEGAPVLLIATSKALRLCRYSRWSIPPVELAVMSSISGLSLLTAMCLVNSSAKPSFFSTYEMVWISGDSNSSSITLSRHCGERFDAVTIRKVS